MESDNKQATTRQTRLNAVMIGVAILAFALWLLWLWLVDWLAVKFGDSETANAAIAHLGQFGDSYGPLNSLFTGGAFIVLIWALLMQREELSLQREELSLQREEMKQTRTVMEQQKFEVTLFNLLNQHNGMVSALKYTSVLGMEKITLFGDGVISQILRECLAFDDLDDVITKPRNIKYKYTAVYSSLSTLLRYMDNFCPKDEAKRYMDVIFTNIGSAEFCLACIYCMGIKDEKMRLCIAKLVPLHNLTYFGTGTRLPELVNQITNYIYGGVGE